MRRILFLPLILLLLSASAPAAKRLAAPVPDDDLRAKLLPAARALLIAEEPEKVIFPPAAGKADGLRAVVLSLTREKAGAVVSFGMAPTLEAAMREAAAELRKRVSTNEIASGRIRIDLVLEQGPVLKIAAGRCGTLPGSRGLWLPESPLLLLPEEMATRPLLAEGRIQREPLVSYVKESRDFSADGNPVAQGRSCSTVGLDSFMEDAGGKVLRIQRPAPPPAADPEALLQASREGGQYLLRHQYEDGLFNYLYDPRANMRFAGYNEVRHAGTAYALLQLYDATRDTQYLAAGEKAIEVMLKWIRSPEDRRFEAIVYERGVAKLGGTALAALAILEHHRLTGEQRWMEHARMLAKFLLAQQQKDGRFDSRYFFGPPLDENFDSMYYPGETILALTRMQQADPSDMMWQEAASRGVDWLVNVRDAGLKTADLPHDHWLLIALNELYPYTKSKTQLAHVTRIASAILQAQRTSPTPPEWVGSFYEPPRSTPAATRAEAMVAMWELAGKTGQTRQPYLDALKKMVAYELRCRLSPEAVMFLPRPDQALGGVLRGLDEWEVRIDYVQHAVCSWLGLRRILLQETKSGRIEPQSSQRTQRGNEGIPREDFSPHS